MNENQLIITLEKYLEKYKMLSYTELETKVNDDQPEIFTSGTLGEDDFYLVELIFVSDDCKSGDVRVLGSANNGSGILIRNLPKQGLTSPPLHP